MKPYHGFKFKICWMNLGMNMAYDNEMDNPTTTFSEGVTKTCNLPPPQSVQADDSNFCFGNTGRRTPPPPCPTDPRSMINTFRFNPERQRDQGAREAGRHFTNPTTVAHTYYIPTFQLSIKITFVFSPPSFFIGVLSSLTLPRPSSIRYYCFPCEVHNPEGEEEEPKALKNRACQHSVDRRTRS